jgi:hypothetical protein
MIVEFGKHIPDKQMDTEQQKHVIESFLLCGNPDPADNNRKRVGPIIRNE